MRHTSPSAIFSRRVLLGSRVVPATIGISDGRIVSLVEGGAAPEGATDLGDRLISPAMTNGHSHLSLSCLRGVGGRAAQAGNVVEDLFYKVEAHLQPGDVRAFVRMGALEALASGTASVLDHYYAAHEVVGGLMDVGLAGLVAPTLQDRGGPGSGGADAAMLATLEIDADPALAARGIGAMLGPHATDTVSDGLFRRIAELAERHALPVHLHLAQSVEEVRRSEAEHGVWPLTRLLRLGLADAAPSVLAVHAQLVRDEELKSCPENVVFGHTPLSQAQYFYTADVHRFLAAGRRVLLGTDCGASADGVDVQRELSIVGAASGLAVSGMADVRALSSASAVQAARAEAFAAGQGLSEPLALLSLVWGVPGGLHPRLQWGEIAVGKLAHIAVWDVDHPAFWPGMDLLRGLAYGAVSPALYGLLVAGRWAGTPGDHARSVAAGADVRVWREEASARLAALLGRAGVALT